MAIGRKFGRRTARAVATAATALMAAGVGLPPAAAAAPPSHLVRPAAVAVKPQDLGTLGGHSARALAISDRGVVVGAAQTAAGHEHAFVWTPRQGMRDLGTLGGSTSRAVAVNKHGAVAGTAQTALGAEHAFLWTPSTGMRDLGTLGGRNSQAVDLNDHGQITGNADSGASSRPFLWSRATGMRTVVGAGFVDAVALRVNNRGMVLGNYGREGIPRAFVASWTGAQDIGDLGAAYQTVAFDLNDRGQVVGYSWVAGGGSHHAFRWDSRSGRMTDLGIGAPVQAPCTFSMAAAINERGEVAGTRVDDDGQNYCSGVFWGRHGTRSTDMPLDPADLNDRGLAVGNLLESWHTPDGEAPGSHAFAWNALTGRTTDLGRGATMAVNDHGQSVGWAPADDFTPRAVLWKVDMPGHGKKEKVPSHLRQVPSLRVGPVEGPSA